MPGFPVLQYLPVCSDSYPFSQWWHPAISSSLIPSSSSCPHSFPASRSFPVSWFFELGGQRVGASASVLPVNVQGWFPLGLTGLISFCPRDSEESSLTPQCFFCVWLYHNLFSQSFVNKPLFYIFLFSVACPWHTVLTLSTGYFAVGLLGQSPQGF